MPEYVKLLEVAQNHFDNAVTPEEVDKAIYELNAAEIAMAIFLKNSKR